MVLFNGLLIHEFRGICGNWDVNGKEETEDISHFAGLS